VSGETAGEISLLAGLPRSSTVRTCGPTRVAEITRAALERAVQRDHGELAAGVMEHIAERRMENMVVESKVPTSGRVPRSTQPRTHASARRYARR